MTPGMAREEVASLIEGLGLGTRAGLSLYLEALSVVAGGRRLDDYDYDCYATTLKTRRGGGVTEWIGVEDESVRDDAFVAPPSACTCARRALSCRLCLTW